MRWIHHNIEGLRKLLRIAIAHREIAWFYIDLLENGNVLKIKTLPFDQVFWINSFFFWLNSMQNMATYQFIWDTFATKLDSFINSIRNLNEPTKINKRLNCKWKATIKLILTIKQQNFLKRNKVSWKVSLTTIDAKNYIEEHERKFGLKRRQICWVLILVSVHHRCNRIYNRYGNCSFPRRFKPKTKKLVFTVSLLDV